MVNLNLLDNLKIVSFNCNGVSSKLPVIANLCESADLVLLQETWLLPVDQNLLDSVSSEFCSFSSSSVDMNELLQGRPYGGLSFLWRKSLDQNLKLITFDDDRIVGISLKAENKDLLLLNVYLPYYSDVN